jgi:tRNA-guanine family transglycosylase
MGQLVNYCAGAELKKRPDKANSYLINAPEHGSSPRLTEKAIALCQDVQPKHLMVDSGGYQLLKAEIKGWKITHEPYRQLTYKIGKEINLVPRHVMEFASKLKAGIVMGLDFPVGKFKTASDREIEFYKKLSLNVRWAHESATWKRRLCPEAQLFLPIQAYTLKQLDVFFSETAEIPYDGVAMPVREAKLHELALFLTYFRQRGIGRVHLLGTAGFLKIAMVAFMANNMFAWVSLDAATWNKSAVHCGFLSPKNLRLVDLRRTVKLDRGFFNDCQCRYCQGRSFGEIQNLPNKEKFEQLRQHNWMAIEGAVADLEASSSDLIHLERFLKDRDVKPADIDGLINTLALVDCLKNDDIEVLQTILAPVLKSRKPSRRPRKETNPVPRPRKPTRTSQNQTQPTHEPVSKSAVVGRPEQNEKVLQED